MPRLLAHDPAPTSPEERQSAILGLIERDGRVAATALAAEFGVSEDSIRRDLRDLSDAGLVQRVYGGAIRRSTTTPAFRDRLARRGLQSSTLAAAVDLLKPGSTVLLDQSTGNLALARQLPAGADVTIVTATPEIAVAALDREVANVVLLGGRLDPGQRSAMGPAVIEAIASIRFDICVLGVCGVDLSLGVTVQDYDDASLKRAMIAASGATIALVAAEKLDTALPFRVAPLARLDRLVVESRTPPETLARYATAGVDILAA